MDVDTLFRRLYPPLFRYLNRLTGEPDTAADIAQEAFVRLLGRPMTEKDARPWLFTVATNLVRDGARQRTRRRRVMAASPTAVPGPRTSPRADETVERGEGIERVRMALDHLSPRDRQMLLMRQEGFRYREIADVVGIAPTSVGTLLARALHRFKEVYGEQRDSDDTHV